MARVSKETLKSYFELGDVPTQNEFADLIDSLALQEDLETLGGEVGDQASDINDLEGMIHAVVTKLGGSIRRVDVDMIDGYYLSNAESPSLVESGSYQITRPIQLSAGETIVLRCNQGGVSAIALTNASASVFTRVVSGFSSKKIYMYTATEDTYVSLCGQKSLFQFAVVTLNVAEKLTELESESYKEIFGGDTYTEINDEKALISEKEVNRTYIRIKNSFSNFRVKGTMAQGYAIAFFVSSVYAEGADIYSTAWLTEIDFSVESKGYLWAKVKKTNDAAITSSEAISAWNNSYITILENKNSRITKSEQWIEANKELENLLIDGEEVESIIPTFIENAYWSTDGNAPASASGYYAVSSLIEVSKGDKIRLYNWNLASAASQGAFAYLYDKSKNAIGQRLNSDIPIREDSYMEYEITNELASYIGLDYLGTPKSGATIHIIRNAPKINPTYLPSNVQSKTVDLIMFMGQSNMAGRGVTSALFPSSYPMPIEGSGYEYRAITNPTGLNNITEPFGKNENLEGAINDGNDKTGSMVTAFINAYYSITKVPVVGVSASEGGTLISQWQPNGARLDDAVNRLSLAVSYLTTNGFTVRHKYMVWCQGESDGDSNRSAEDYTNMFNAMFNAMKSHGIEKCFLVRIGKYNGSGASDYSTIINAQTEICKNNYDVIMASTALASFKDDGLMKDAFHYYQEGYNRIGSYAGENVGLYVIGGKEPIMYDATTEGLYFSRWSY